MKGKRERKSSRIDGARSELYYILRRSICIMIVSVIPSDYTPVASMVQWISAHLHKTCLRINGIQSQSLSTLCELLGQC